MSFNRLWSSFLLFALGICSGVALLKGYQYFKLVQAQTQRQATAVHADMVPSRVEVPLETVRSDRMMVALAFGQSNSANYGETPQKATRMVFNFYGGKLYRAEDPLLGANGDGGSIWTRLGDHLIERNIYDTVTFVSIGAGASRVAHWQPGGDLHQRLIHSIRDLRRSGLRLTHLLWDQGGSDMVADTSTAAYQTMFRAMLASIREEGVTAPIYVPKAGAVRCVRGHRVPNPAIRRAQQHLVDAPRGIFPGPDMSALGLEYRYDGCHYTDEGLEQASRLWLEALNAPRTTAPL